MPNASQSAYQLCYIKEKIIEKDFLPDNCARALKVMIPVWLKAFPRDLFDVSFYEKTDTGSFQSHLGLVLYSSIGNGFLFSSDGLIFWYECQEYQMIEHFNGSFVCPRLNLSEIATYAEEIIEALSSIAPDISHCYCTTLQHNQTT